MVQDAPKPADPLYQYSAFISYSRKDAAFARWLHQRLEGFRFPTYDGRKLTRNAKFPLSPAFRDLDELAASGDLGDSIRKSLDASGALVVLCSPAAAASPWVNKEIQHFLSLGRHERILPVLLAGEPVFGGPGAPPNAAFPEALKDDPTEALWIDARGVEGKDRVFARIAAGLLQVSFDQVWKRRQRAERQRIVMSAVAAVLVGVPLVAFAWTASQPIRMADCPIDRLVFTDGWLKGMDAQQIKVTRVGATHIAYCGQSIEPKLWTKAMETDINCAGPYGDTVFEGEFRPEASKEILRDIYPSYHIEPGVPCCWWDIRNKETVEKIIKDPTFSWYPSGRAPPLSEMPFNEIQTTDQFEVIDERYTENKTLAASECRVGLGERMGLSLKRIASWFAPKDDGELSEDELNELLEQQEKLIEQQNRQQR